MDYTLSILLVAIIIVIYVTEFRNPERTLCSNNDGQCYKISTSFDDQHEAVDELSRINQFNAKFIKYLRNKYLWIETPNQTMREITTNLIANYNPDVLKENNPSDTTNTSYVLDKGRTIAFCLREKDSGNHQMEDEQMLNFVNIHEISHLAMSHHDPDHGPEFWITFKLLLGEATNAGLYKPIDWGQTPKKYCGLTVNYNPFYDENV
jgi:hypothetical protein